MRHGTQASHWRRFDAPVCLCCENSGSHRCGLRLLYICAAPLLFAVGQTTRRVRLPCLIRAGAGFGQNSREKGAWKTTCGDGGDESGGRNSRWWQDMTGLAGRARFAVSFFRLSRRRRRLRVCSWTDAPAPAGYGLNEARMETATVNSFESRVPSLSR